MLDLARADAERQRAERAVRGGVGVAADDRHARLGDAQLRPDDVDDALALGAERVQRDAELVAVGLERLDLPARQRVADLAATGVPSVGTLWSAVASVRSGPADLAPGEPQPSNACALVTSWTRWRSM